MLTANQISFSIKGKNLLENISLEVKPGEVLAIIGANGAGKSTLLKALSGETKSSAERITLNKKPLSEYSSKELAFTRAVMPQSVELNFPFRVEQVVEMGRSAFSDSTSNDSIINEALELFDVKKFSQRSYTDLSGGEKQRVQLARVVAQIWPDGITNNRYLFLDECTSALDIRFQHSVFQTIRDFARNNIGVIAIVHDLNLAARYADKVLVLKEGKEIAQGEVETNLTADIIREAFGIDVLITDHPKESFPLIVNL